jgi:hypothetical protein
MFGWFWDLNAKERGAMLPCFGGWSLAVQVYSFVMPTLKRLMVDQQGRGRACRHGDAVDLLVRRLVFSRTLQPLRPRADAADHDPLVRGFQVSLRLPNEFRAALRAACALHGCGGEWAAGAVMIDEPDGFDPQQTSHARSDKARLLSVPRPPGAAADRFGWVSPTGSGATRR